MRYVASIRKMCYSLFSLRLGTFLISLISDQVLQKLVVISLGNRICSMSTLNSVPITRLRELGAPDTYGLTFRLRSDKVLLNIRHSLDSPMSKLERLD